MRGLIVRAASVFAMTLALLVPSREAEATTAPCTFCVFGARCNVETIESLCRGNCNGNPAGSCGTHASCEGGSFWLMCFGNET